MKRVERHRPERISELVRQAISTALATELKDPRVGFVTVTRVTVSPDISHANVYVSVMGSDEEKARAMEGLENATGFLRTYVARQLHVGTAPELHMELDRGLEHATHIDEILQKLDHERER